MRLKSGEERGEWHCARRDRTIERSGSGPFSPRDGRRTPPRWPSAPTAPRSCGTCTRSSAMDDDAREAFSQFAENLWRGLPEFQGRAPFRIWAYRIAWNAACDIRKQPWRNRRRRPEHGSGVPDRRHRRHLHRREAGAAPAGPRIAARVALHRRPRARGPAHRPGALLGRVRGGALHRRAHGEGEHPHQALRADQGAAGQAGQEEGAPRAVSARPSGAGDESPGTLTSLVERGLPRLAHGRRSDWVDGLAPGAALGRYDLHPRGRSRRVRRGLGGSRPGAGAAGGR